VNFVPSLKSYCSTLSNSCLLYRIFVLCYLNYVLNTTTLGNYCLITCCAGALACLTVIVIYCYAQCGSLVLLFKLGQAFSTTTFCLIAYILFKYCPLLCCQANGLQAYAVTLITYLGLWW
jgi:hypothetical protein